MLYQRFSIGAGYGYNLVLGDTHWLLHASVIPMWTFLDLTNITLKGRSDKYAHPAGMISFSGTTRAGVYYRWGDRWSIGLSGIGNRMASANGLRPEKDGYRHFSGHDWQARLSLGFRF